MTYKIRHRYQEDCILYETEAESLREAVEKAAKRGIDLRYANLEGANLKGADLKGANLEGADLVGANLEGADLVGANLVGADLVGADLVGADLVGANLVGADLVGADLVGANLKGANLKGADLKGANLEGADLVGANLVGANLVGADLDSIKADFYLILLNAIPEVAGLRKALIEGRVDGSTYSGSCACLVGTIANVRGCNYQDLQNITPNSGRPAETWFLNIRKGDKPENNPIAKITLQWVDEFNSLINAAREVQP